MGNSKSCILCFLGGLVLGAATTAVICRSKIDIKRVSSDLLSHGYDLKDSLLAKIETCREDMEDIMAEARYTAGKRRDATDAGDGGQSGPIAGETA